MRVCLVSERLSPPYDEGIKNFAYQLACGLDAKHDLCVLTAFASEAAAEGPLRIRNPRTNKLFASLAMARAIRDHSPELIIYVPTASATTFSFARSRVLKWYGRGVPVVIVALQWRPYGRLARLAMPHLKPDLVLVQSRVTQEALESFQLRLAQLVPGISLDRFRPLSGEERHAQRLRYGIDSQAYVVLHVGHLNRGRNVQAMLEIQRHADIPNLQCLVVGSSSTDQDRELVAELEAGGVLVVDGYVDQIERIYGLSDCYLFPVNGRMSAIDLPLSVLEAMACDLAVVTTCFGGLEALFQASAGLHYAASADEMISSIEACCGLKAPGTRAMVAPYDWPNTTESVMGLVERELGLSGHPVDERCPLPDSGAVAK